MLESVFIWIISVGFVSFVLAVLDENLILSAVSLLMFIVSLAGQIYVEVPSDTYYDEPVFFAISLGFIFLNIIYIIILYFDFQFWRQQP